METVTIAGKPSTVVGTANSNLILRGLSVKVQWGNKFIDLIKNGKISNSSEFSIKKVNNKEDIQNTGFYQVGEQLYLCIDNSIIDLTTDKDLYVSFLNKLKVNLDLKKTALENIGFYYNSLSDVTEVETGIIYVIDEQKLYTVSKGILKEYVPSIKTTEDYSNLKEFKLGNLHIYEENNQIYVNFPKMSLDKYFTLNSVITVHTDLITEKSIKSNDYSPNTGYSIYTFNGESVLEIDRVIERKKESETFSLLSDSNIHSNYDNIVVSSNLNYDIEFDENDVAKEIITGITLELKYPPIQNVGDTIYINTESDKYYLTKLLESSKDGSTIQLMLNYTTSTDKTFRVTYSYYQEYEIDGNILYKEVDDIVIITISPDKYIERVTFDNIFITKIKNVVELLPKDFEKIEVGFIKNQILKYTINSIDLNFITILLSKNNSELEFLYLHKTIKGKEVHLLSEPYIEINDNNIQLVDIKEQKESRNHTKLGLVDEKYFPNLFLEAKKDDYLDISIKPKVGIYSDNLIALNPILYNACFKTLGLDIQTEYPNYPKYFNEVELPGETKKDLQQDEENPKLNKIRIDKKFNQVVPNLEWVKSMIDIFVPIGTIVMFGGTKDQIPIGWHICDGEEGTPNLINRFIKGGEESKKGRNLTENKILLTSENIPKLDLESDDRFAYGHDTININKSESGTEVSVVNLIYYKPVEFETKLNVEPINIEPNSYSLIFIMKIKNFYDIEI